MLHSSLIIIPHFAAPLQTTARLQSIIQALLAIRFIISANYSPAGAISVIRARFIRQVRHRAAYIYSIVRYDSCALNGVWNGGYWQRGYVAAIGPQLSGVDGRRAPTGITGRGPGLPGRSPGIVQH